MSSRRLALWLAGCTGGVLVVMVIVSITTGATQEAHEFYRPPADYAASLLEHPNALRLTFGLDIAFLVLYTAFFTALADFLRKLGMPLFVWLALGAMIGTALLDIVEDHHILALLTVAESHRPIDEGAIVFQHALSATKFSLSYVSLVMFGLAIPRTTTLGILLALFLTVGTLVTAVLNYGAPAEWREQLDSTRWIGFLVGFGFAVAWLRSAPEPAKT